jgi:tetratricopeptide (TPR) repeat protein
MRRFAAIMALFCVVAVRAQELSPEQLFREAQQAQQSGDNELAVQKYQELLASHPQVVAARANLGIALAALGRYDEAVAQDTAALQLVPGNRDLRMNLALAYYKGQKIAEAAEQFASLLQEDPKNARVATLLGDCYVRLGKDTEAISLLTPFEQADPGNLTIEWTLGSALIRTGQTREGLLRVDKVAAQKPSPQVYTLAAETHLRLEEFEEARRYADLAVKADPDLPGVNTLSGLVREYSGDLEGAQEAFRRAIAQKPDDFEAHLRLGSVLYQLRKLDEAQTQLELALQIEPTSSYARFELAKVQNAQGQIQAALKNFEAVAQAIPEWLPPHVELAALYFKLKRPEDGAREKQIVDRITEEERQKKMKSPVISPQLPSR